jgi:hypothetical protein
MIKKNQIYSYFRKRVFIALFNYTTDKENALNTSEVKPTDMTSDEALTELQKAKNKLDLGLISKENLNH